MYLLSKSTSSVCRARFLYIFAITKSLNCIGAFHHRDGGRFTLSATAAADHNNYKSFIETSFLCTPTPPTPVTTIIVFVVHHVHVTVKARSLSKARVHYIVNVRIYRLYIFGKS